MQERFRLIVAKTKVIKVANQKEGKHRKDNLYGCLGEHTFVYENNSYIQRLGPGVYLFPHFLLKGFNSQSKFSIHPRRPNSTEVVRISIRVKRLVPWRHHRFFVLFKPKQHGVYNIRVVFSLVHILTRVS